MRPCTFRADPFASPLAKSVWMELSAPMTLVKCAVSPGAAGAARNNRAPGPDQCG
jgi:hypothetical protein